MRSGSAVRAIGAGLASLFIAAAMFAACGADCESPNDCNFGEGCFDGTCVDLSTGDTCSVDSECVAGGVSGATAFCNAGRCQLRLERPAPVLPDAGATDGGPGDGGPGGNGDGGPSADAGPVDECDPVVPTTCPEGETCELDENRVLRCETAGPVEIGDICDDEACTREGICLLFTGMTNRRCYAACNDASDCTAPQMCQPLNELSFGLCQ